MIFIEMIAVGVAMAVLIGVIPGLQAWFKSGPLQPTQPAAPSAQSPSRLMAKLVQPDPFPSRVSSALPLTVMVLTVANGNFTPEAGAAVSFSVAGGCASVNGSSAITQSTDRMGKVTAQLTTVRTGHEELIVSVVVRGVSMPVAPPIHFETLG